MLTDEAAKRHIIKLQAFQIERRDRASRGLDRPTFVRLLLTEHGAPGIRDPDPIHARADDHARTRFLLAGAS